MRGISAVLSSCRERKKFAKGGHSVTHQPVSVLSVSATERLVSLESWGAVYIKDVDLHFLEDLLKCINPVLFQKSQLRIGKRKHQ